MSNRGKRITVEDKVSRRYKQVIMRYLKLRGFITHPPMCPRDAECRRLIKDHMGITLKTQEELKSYAAELVRSCENSSRIVLNQTERMKSRVPSKSPKPVELQYFRYIPPDNVRKDPNYSREKYAEFRQTDEWAELRIRTLAKFPYCCLCGATVKSGAILTADHIVPVSWDWSKRNDPNNLQTLCLPCNTGKGNNFADDWR
jgi:5-methylcytosine-specific restriction endonuclease McrA